MFGTAPVAPVAPPAAAPPAPPAPVPAAPAAPVTPDLPPEVTAALAGLTDEQREALLKDTGRSALQKERDKAKAASDRAVAAEAEVKAFKDAQLTAEQKAAADAAAATERATTMTQRAVRAEIKALATGQFADPADAALDLDPTKYVNAAGDIDDDAIKADLAALLVRKPHWAAVDADGKRRAPAPDKGQGKGSESGVEPQNVVELRAQLDQALKDNNGTRVAVVRSQLARAIQQSTAATTP